MATGDWLMWLNADDYLLPGALDGFESLPRVTQMPTLSMATASLLMSKGESCAEKLNFLLILACCFLRLLYPLHCHFLSSAHFRQRLLNPEYRVVMDFEYFVRLARNCYRFNTCPMLSRAFVGMNQTLARRSSSFETKSD